MHAIVIKNKEGAVMAGNIIHMENGRLANDTPLHVVKRIVSDAVEKGNIVVHFHGGLVSESRAREMAQRLTPIYDQAGAYLIFPVWESGLFETLANNLGHLATEKLFQVVLTRVRSIARRKFAQDDGGRIAGAVPTIDDTDENKALIKALITGNVSLMPTDPRPVPGLTPLSDMEKMTLEMELQGDPEIQIVTQSVSAELRDPADIASDEAVRSVSPVIASSATLMDPDVVEQLVDRPVPTSRGIISTTKIALAIVKVAGSVIDRHLDGRDHGFHATVVEEILRAFYVANIGGAIWKQMKNDTKDSFGDNPTQYGGTALLSELGDRIQDGERPNITLVGHSTGAVYIAHFLEAADSLIPAGFTFNIVLLAPASTFDLTAKTFIPYQARIKGIRMFTMTDANEKADRLVPVLYPHSLLYFVSGVVEPDADTPLIGMNRYYDPSQYDASKFQKIEEIRQFISNFTNGVVWSDSTGNVAGLNTKALKHGDFDNDPTTLVSVQEIIQNGF
jgi:hypothetical protein